MLAFLRYGLFSALLFGVLYQGGFAQTLPPRITSYSPDEYNAHGQIFSTEPLLKGQRAYGTSREILFHNGESFSHIDVGDGKYVFSMDRSRDSRLFVGGNFLMGVIAPDRRGIPTYHSLQPLLPDSLKSFGRIWNTHCDEKGGVYFNARQYLFYYKDDRIKAIRPETEFFKAYRVSDRIVIEDADSGLFVLEGAKKRYLPKSDTLAKGRTVHAILPSAKGDKKTWTILTGSNGIYRYHPSTGDLSRPNQGSSSSRLREFRNSGVYNGTRLDPKKNPYGAAYAVGTRWKGLYLLDPNGRIVLQLGREDGLPAQAIWQVETDRNGNVQVASNNGIAIVHTGLPFTFGEEGKLFNGAVRDISRGAPSEQGGTGKESPLFLATEQGTWTWDEDQKSFSIVGGIERQCKRLHPFHPDDRSSRMLISTGQAGLISTPSTHRGMDQDPQADTLFRDHCYSAKEISTPRGKGILKGGRTGVHVLSRGTSKDAPWKELLSLEDIPEEIQSVGVDPMKEKPDSLRIWAGLPSRGVLSVVTDTAFDDHRVTHYADRLPQGEVQVFSDPSEEREGVLFGTETGLYIHEDGRFRPCCRYGRVFCDSSRQVFRLAKGENGNVWIGDGVGGDAKHLIAEGENYRIDSTIFRALGLGTVRAYFPERSRTWLGGDQGIACYFPNIRMDPQRAWDCRLDRVKGSGDSLLFGGSFYETSGERKAGQDSAYKVRVPVKEQPEQMTPTLPYAKNRMEFIFSAAFPTFQNAVQYSYKLEGFDTAWSKWGRETKKEYTNLPEGKYKFTVKARNIYNKVSSTAEYRFRILPPWYRTSLAYAGYGLTGVLTVALMAWLWVRKVRADKRAKEYLEGLEKANVEIREEKEKVEEAHEEITQSIDYAQKIQQALLQSEQHDATGIPEHFILFKPYSQVSGDFYWAKEHKGHFYIAAVDCTGHGVPGAFMSMLGISQLNEVMNTDEELSPGQILTDLRERVVRELSGNDPESAAKDGMDAAIVRVPIGNSNSNSNSNSKAGEMEVEFAGAQNPLYVIREGMAEDGPGRFRNLSGQDDDPGSPNSANNILGPIDLTGPKDPSDQNDDGDLGRIRAFKKSADGIEIKGDGQPVGYDEHAKDAFTTVSLKLQKGDMLYIFSDGYADQFGGPKGKKFRYGPFKQLLASLHEKPLEEQKQELDKTFEDWKAEGQQEQIDDVVVIGVSL